MPKVEAQPQMVGKCGLSDDKLTWTFELRDGLKWHDGTPVTSADVMPSIRRWAARDGAWPAHDAARQGHLGEGRKDVPDLPEGALRSGASTCLRKTPTPLSWMMRKKEAETDPMQKIDDFIGSGPFILNQAETKPGSQYVFDKNPNYVPRSEPPSGIAGGKVVKVDRVMFMNMPDSQTAVAALQAGEIDFYEIPQPDFMDQLRVRQEHQD